MVTDFLESWAKTIVERPSGELRASITVEGVRDAHLGPRCEFAKVTIRVEPADRFQVTFDLPDGDRLEQRGYLTAAVFGFLDVALVAASMPLRNVHLIILNAEADEIDSSKRAFRMAGRDAATKLLTASRNVPGEFAL